MFSSSVLSDIARSTVNGACASSPCSVDVWQPALRVASGYLVVLAGHGKEVWSSEREVGLCGVLGEVVCHGGLRSWGHCFVA